MKNIMVTRLFSIVFLSSILLSCSMTMEDRSPYGSSGYYPMTYDERTANVPIAMHRGLNVDMMDYRLGALLAEAQKLDNDMDMLLARMNALHMDIKQHKKQSDAASAAEAVAIETPQVLVAIKEGQESAKEDMPVAVKKEAEPKPAPQKPKSKAEVMPLKDGVNRVRHGVHKGKTRLVFDINGSTIHDIDFDKDVGLVTITLPKTKWNTASSKNYTLQQLSGYDAKSQEQGGSVVALVVKNTSDVKTSTMKKSGTKPARLVVDLMR